ncbi:MAG: Gfo/Idh/MocA family oxidoreductase [Gemmatimonadales bacterium]|nr:MAG: Gfo/Idh/MocA family oxidoreductase [Gemmatimonadales bacterium]
MSDKRPPNRSAPEDPTPSVTGEGAPESALPRRDLLKLGALGAGAAALGGLAGCAPGNGGSVAAGELSAAPPAGLGAAPDEFFSAPPMDTVRVGFVGVGGMGGAHVQNFLRIDGVEIRAICDINEPRAQEVAGWVTEAGNPAPTLYTRGEYDFERLCQEEELDLVFTATPWRWHVPVCVAAMENGKHAATEVPAAYTLEDCWRLVEVAEARGKHCVMMENCNYDRPEMMVFHLARQGLLGEILHAECGYLHDLRGIKFSETGEGLWRRDHSMTRNGNLYPTHGLGPVANVMDINRGDQFATLVSMSSPSRGLQEWARTNYPEGHPKRRETYVLGDVNVSLIQTHNGRTIYLSHDTNLPRPYSRIHMVQGTKGIFQGYPHRVHIEGMSPGHRWQEWTELLEEHDHPLWKDLEEQSAGAGHGGMDYIEDYRLVKCLREGRPTDMNVYDAAALSAVGPLSEWSVANGSRPAEFPDFTRGKWRSYPKLEIFRA